MSGDTVIGASVHPLLDGDGVVAETMVAKWPRKVVLVKAMADVTSSSSNGNNARANGIWRPAIVVPTHEMDLRTMVCDRGSHGSDSIPSISKEECIVRYFETRTFSVVFRSTVCLLKWDREPITSLRRKRSHKLQNLHMKEAVTMSKSSLVPRSMVWDAWMADEMSTKRKRRHSNADWLTHLSDGSGASDFGDDSDGDDDANNTSHGDSGEDSEGSRKQSKKASKKSEVYNNNDSSDNNNSDCSDESMREERPTKAKNTAGQQGAKPRGAYSSLYDSLMDPSMLSGRTSGRENRRRSNNTSKQAANDDSSMGEDRSNKKKISDTKNRYNNSNRNNNTSKRLSAGSNSSNNNSSGSAEKKYRRNMNDGLVDALMDPRIFDSGPRRRQQAFGASNGNMKANDSADKASRHGLARERHLSVGDDNDGTRNGRRQRAGASERVGSAPPSSSGDNNDSGNNSNAKAVNDSRQSKSDDDEIEPGSRRKTGTNTDSHSNGKSGKNGLQTDVQSSSHGLKTRRRRRNSTYHSSPSDTDVDASGSDSETSISEADDTKSNNNKLVVTRQHKTHLDCKYQITEKIRVYTRGDLYEGKIVDIKKERIKSRGKTHVSIQYRVHYTGWSNKYDEWVPESLALDVAKPKQQKKKQSATSSTVSSKRASPEKDLDTASPKRQRRSVGGGEDDDNERGSGDDTFMAMVNAGSDSGTNTSNARASKKQNSSKNGASQDGGDCDDGSSIDDNEQRQGVHGSERAAAKERQRLCNANEEEPGEGTEEIKRVVPKRESKSSELDGIYVRENSQMYMEDAPPKQVTPPMASSLNVDRNRTNNHNNTSRSLQRRGASTVKKEHETAVVGSDVVLGDGRRNMGERETSVMSVDLEQLSSVVRPKRRGRAYSSSRHVRNTADSNDEEVAELTALTKPRASRGRNDYDEDDGHRNEAVMRALKDRATPTPTLPVISKQSTIIDKERKEESVNRSANDNNTHVTEDEVDNASGLSSTSLAAAAAAAGATRQVATRSSSAAPVGPNGINGGDGVSFTGSKIHPKQWSRRSRTHIASVSSNGTTDRGSMEDLTMKDDYIYMGVGGATSSSLAIGAATNDSISDSVHGSRFSSRQTSYDSNGTGAATAAREKRPHVTEGINTSEISIGTTKKLSNGSSPAAKVESNTRDAIISKPTMKSENEYNSNHKAKTPLSSSTTLNSKTNETKIKAESPVTIAAAPIGGSSCADSSVSFANGGSLEDKLQELRRQYMLHKNVLKKLESANK